MHELVETYIKPVQRKLGVDDDGVAGERTWHAIAAELNALPGEPRPPILGASIGADPRSESNIATLLPVFQPLARRFLNAVNTKLAVDHPGIICKIISGTRSDAEQNALYAKGRTAPGPVVTNARAGYSNHNFGIAFDIGFFRGAEYLKGAEAERLYKMAGGLGKALGLSWGGDWKSIKDTPHFELKTGYTLAQMRERKLKGLAYA